MPNTILTMTQVTRKALQILHEKLTFCGTINRQYDSAFAIKGAKIGSQLKIRKPNKYTVGTGRTISPQSTVEDSETLTVATQKHVPMSFFSDELTLSMDDFAPRVIEPAMAVLAAEVESDILANLSLDVYNSTGTPGTTPNTFLHYLNARTKLNQYLAPKDNNRNVLINSTAMASSVDAMKALFHDGQSIAHQYKEGFLMRTAGLNFYESEHVTTLTTGSDFTSVTVNGASQTGSTLTVAGANVNEGDVFTIANVYAVHPESKASYDHLQQFVCTAAGTTSLSISPAIITEGAHQNVDAGPANGAALTFAGSASTAYPINLAYHKDAFTLVTADLERYKDAHTCIIEVYDGISMRLWQASDVLNDRLITRVDILYGFLTVRPELATRIWG
jgi:hypothetical protein